MSAYDNDARVLWREKEWPPDIAAQIPDRQWDRTLLVQAVGPSQFAVIVATDADHDYSTLYATVDEALASVLGEPTC